MSTNLFDFTNYPSQSYNDQPFGWGNKTFDTVDKKSYLLSYVFTHRPYADVPALYAAIIQAKTNIANQNFTNLYTGLQSSLTGSEVMTAISANSPSFQSKMDIIVP